MARKSKAGRASGNTILLVDDNPEYLEATRLVLEREGHQVLTAANGPDALAILQKTNVDLLLLDYFMPGMTGEEVVTQLRKFNQYVQVILQTGYASEQPPRELLRRLDIQGYYDKSEGPDKLLLWTDVGLKTAYTIQLLQKSRQGLNYILDITPELHKIQPLSDLLQGILWQVAGLLGAANTFLAVLPEGGVLKHPSIEPEGFVAMMQEDTELVIQASTGRFTSFQRVDNCLEPEKIEWIRIALQRGEIQIIESHTIVPLRVGELTIGTIYLDRPALAERDVNLVQIFANQAAVAIQNTQLYEMATLDPLTGVYVRRFFEQWLQRDLRTAFRSRQPLSLLLLDLDGFKQINDLAGHLAGDQALATVGRVLRQATRGSDIVGRYGGDEFAIILPHTPLDGAEIVGRRILEALKDKSVPGAMGDIALRGSVGLSVLLPHSFPPATIPRPVPNIYFQNMATLLIQQADVALYAVKHSGGHHLQPTEAIKWAPMESLLEAQVASDEP
jgi:diguanylate cyclase (GGDEF)-like protein